MVGWDDAQVWECPKCQFRMKNPYAKEVFHNCKKAKKNVQLKKVNDD